MSIENDLRPISLTLQISKVMERFTLRTLLSQVSHKLDTSQFSLPRKSTTHALILFYIQSLKAWIEVAVQQGYSLLTSRKVLIW